MDLITSNTVKPLQSSDDNLPPVLSMAKKFAEEGVYNEAEQYCQNYLALHPNAANGLRILSWLYEQQRLHEAVIDTIQQYEQHHPITITLSARKSRAYSGLYLHNDAIATARQCAVLSKGSFKSLNRLATALSRAGEFDEALAIYEKLFIKNKKNVSLCLSYSTLLIELGKNEEAIKLLHHVLAISPKACRAYLNLSNIKSFRFSDDDIKAMLKLDSRRTYSPKNAIYLNLALGKAFEDKQEFDKSFSYYARAKSIKASRNPSDPEEFENKYRHIIESINHDFFQERKNTGCGDASPIFIVGLHRSGSTLIDQILSSHSQVDGTRELPYIPGIAKRITKTQEDYSIVSARYARGLIHTELEQLESYGEAYLQSAETLRQGGVYFLDKKPENFIHIGLIHAILPNAKIIDARRHPMAVGFSIFRQMFSARLGHTNKLFDIGRYYRSYLQLMCHWHTVLPGKVHRVQYEEMVNDTENTIRQLLDYCGLPFEQACLEFYNNKRPIKTPSAEQVRQPIYKDAMEQWKNYEKYLQPLKEGLGDSLEMYLTD